MANKFKDMTKLIENHKKNGQTSYVFVYLAGHGTADTQQYFMLNADTFEEALFPIEEYLRTLSARAGKGTCCIFAIYDICRTKAAKLI